MISTSNVSFSFSGQNLFDEVNVKFTPGNCYGLIGANGAGKSTFVKMLAGEIDPITGVIDIPAGKRISVLKQDHFAFDEYTALETVLMGNSKLYEIKREKDALYAKPDFSEEDGVKAADLEQAFGDMGGWEAESDAASLLEELRIPTSLHDKLMKDLDGDEKVRVLLAQALSGSPDVLLLDEPTNHLDLKSIHWLENFLLDFKNTVIVVSHDRHFLNKVCTHIADIDYKKIRTYAGNYTFWRESIELAQKLQAQQNKKAEEKAKDLKTFIQRFSANASKSKQATSRQKQLDNLEIADLPQSSRRNPFVGFNMKRSLGRDVLEVNGISKTIDGEKLLDNVSFTVNDGDKIVFLGENDVAKTTLLKILNGDIEPDSGTVKWGITTTRCDLPMDNSSFFDGNDLNAVDWLRQFSDDKDEEFIRGFLGKMLFSGDDALKKVKVFSGGERVRCMLSRLMLSGANVLLVDGPTNHLDLESISAVNDGLARFEGCILFTSNDHQFIQTVANRIIEINGTVTDDKVTTYDEYLESKGLL
ncbi:MAG: ABC transporter ATP-binding protein [Bdellovibrionaceae bacterium]|nr:ABC transporter ATP-binding protein [Pseudobdellovibrionaceae bacterium]